MIKDRPNTTGALALDKIRIDGGTQMRADLNEDVVAEYAQIVRDGGDFPPVVVFFDGSKHWLADGFHRHFAYQRAGAFEIPAEIRKGSKRDAILHSVGANAEHGLRRTNADKRKAVETLLKDKEWAAWSDREVARACGLTHPFVGKVRAELSGNGFQMPETRHVERQGTSYQQNTANIGKGKSAEAANTSSAEQDATNADAKAAKEAQREEADRWHAEQRAAVPEHIRQAEALRDEAIAKRREAAGGDADDDGLTDDQRIAELREHITVVEAENTMLKAENGKYEAMRVQFEQGGFEKVVTGKNEELRVAREQLALENADKITWMGKAKHWKREAERLGWKPDVLTIDTKTGALKDA